MMQVQENGSIWLEDHFATVAFFLENILKILKEGCEKVVTTAIIY